MRRTSAAGLSVTEALLALALTMAAAGAAVPAMLEIDRAVRLRSAASFLSGYLQRARSEAVRRSANVAVRFRPAVEDWLLCLYVDGNGNGVRAADIASGIDIAIDAEHAFGTRAGAVRLARLASVPDVSGGAGGEAVRFGASALASFDRDGSASSGSVYLTDSRTQIAVTVTPATGRVRIRQWDARLRVWRQMR